jgi:hypothetical protein
MARAVAGLFADQVTARQAVSDLEAAGFDPARVHLLSAEQEPRDLPPLQHAARSTTGAVVGVVLLAAIGAGIGLLATVLWPYHTTASIIYGTVVAACIGGVTGWLVGALAARRVDVEREEYYRERAQQGRTVLVADAGARDAEVRQILGHYGAEAVPPMTMRQTILPLLRSRRPPRASDTQGRNPAAT